MDVSIVVASIAGTVALASAMLATTQATKARKSGRTEQLEAKLDQLTADRHLLYLWNRQLVDHIYRGIGPPPPPRTLHKLLKRNPHAYRPPHHPPLPLPHRPHRTRDRPPHRPLATRDPHRYPRRRKHLRRHRTRHRRTQHPPTHPHHQRPTPRTTTTALTTTTTTQSLVNTNQPPHFCGGWFVSWGCDTVQGCGKNAVQYSSTDVEIAHQYELPNGVVVVGRPAHAGVNHLRHTGDYLLVSFPRTRGGLKASVLRYRGLRVFWTSGRGKDSPPHSHHLPTRLAGRPPWVPPGPPPDTPCPATAHHQAAHTGPSYQPTHDPKDAAPLGGRNRVRASS